ncbi:unnamed protein product [Rhizophagus irregularis]|nr:unnamed protein product [Rhizophagus irregularis]
MSNITTRSKAKTIDKRTLQDSEIVKEVYSVNPEPQQIQDNNPENTNKKLKSDNIPDNTEAMDIEVGEISSPTDAPQSHDLQSGSTHEPMITDQPNSNDQQNDTNPIKGKDKESLQIEQLDYNDTETQTTTFETFSVFLPRDAFPSEDSHLEIRKKIRDAFSNHINDILRIKWEKHQYLTVFIIEFSSKIVYEKYVQKRHLLLNAPIFKYDSSNIEAYIQRGVELQAKNSVKLTDVPIFYETEALIKNIINITGKEIKNFHSNETKIIRNFENEMKRFRQNNSGRRNGRFAPKQPQYKTIYIEFKTEAGAKYLLEKGWSLNIEDFNIKILPTNNNHALYKERTTTGYKITGLPNNTNVKDMTKIMTLIKGETCSIPKARSRFCTKTAYVMVASNNFNDKIKKLNAFNTTLFIIPLENKVRTCMQCGSPEHMIQDCSAEHTVGQNGQKFFKSLLIPRNTTKITVSKSISDNYGTIMKINEDFNKRAPARHNNVKPFQRNPQLNQQPWINRNPNNQNSISPRNFRSPQHTSQPQKITSSQTDDNILLELATLKDQMKWAEKHINDLEAKVASQQKDIENFKTFAENINSHNETVKVSIDKLIAFQEHRAERDSITDAQIGEILNAVKGQQSTTDTGPIPLQQQPLQFQYIPDHNLNQNTTYQYNRNHSEGRTTPTNNNYNTPPIQASFQVYNPNNFQQGLDNNFGDYSHHDQGWDYDSSDSSLHTPKSASNPNSPTYNEEVTDLHQDEHLSQYGDNNNHYEDQGESSQNNNNSPGFTGYLKSFVR